MTQRVLIIGAGQAGFQTAMSLRRKGFEGDIVLAGSEAHAPYERPPLSKAYLKGGLPAERLAFRKAAFFAEKGIDLRLGTPVTGLDRKARTAALADGTRLSYDAAVLATGASVRRLGVPGGDLPGLVTLRTIEDADALRTRIGPDKRLAVVGGGYIGLEVAAAARAAGAAVTVIEARDRVMARVTSAPVSAFLQDLHRRNGVDLRLEAQIAGVRKNETGFAVEMASGDRLQADAVVVGVGIAPEDGLARAAGLSCDDGVLVDAQGRTSDPAIYAAGDCTRFPQAPERRLVRLESVQNAVDQAKAAAAAICGEDAPYEAVPWFWSEQYDVKLQTAGLFRPDDAVAIRGKPEEGRFSVCYLRGGRLAAIDTVNSLRDFTQGKKLIAAAALVDADRLADGSIPLKEAARA